MVIKLIFGLIIFLLLALISVGWYFYNVGVLRRRKTFLQDDPDLPRSNSGDKSLSKEWLGKQMVQKLTLKSYDGLNLTGYYLPASNPIGKTVLLIHGYSSKAADMAVFAKYYHEKHGFNVLMPDCRGHGESEGAYIGFGWHDRKDIIKWVDLLLQENQEEEIILHGISMGGAAVLMASGENLPPNIKCIISDCAYTSAVDILAFQIKRMYKLPPIPLMQITSIISKVRAGYYFKEASALNQVSKSKIPTLFIHGSEDGFVPTEMVYALYKGAICKKDLLIIEKAGHGEAYWQETHTYENKVEGFISMFMDPSIIK